MSSPLTVWVKLKTMTCDEGGFILHCDNHSINNFVMIYSWFTFPDLTFNIPFLAVYHVVPVHFLKFLEWVFFHHLDFSVVSFTFPSASYIENHRLGLQTFLPRKLSSPLPTVDKVFLLCAFAIPRTTFTISFIIIFIHSFSR